MSTTSSITSPSQSSPLFPTTPFHTPSAVGTPTVSSTGNNSGSGNGGLGSNATLYLYTFLATLVLLIGVSSAIVLRSLVLRRRHQRLVEDAIQNGTWIPINPTQGSGGGRRKFGKKPKTWEARLGDDWGWETGGGEKEWRDNIPVSASYVRKPSRAPPSSQEQNDPPPTLTSRWFRPFGSTRFARDSSSVVPRPYITSLPSTPVSCNQCTQATSPLESSPGEEEARREVRVAVLIAMPDPSRPLCHNTVSGSQQTQNIAPGSAEERELGGRVFEFGVVDVPLEDRL